MLFQANIGLVSAEEYVSDFDEQTEVEEVSEALNVTGDTLKFEEDITISEEVTSNEESDTEVMPTSSNMSPT